MIKRKKIAPGALREEVKAVLSGKATVAEVAKRLECSERAVQRAVQSAKKDLDKQTKPVQEGGTPGADKGRKALEDAGIVPPEKKPDAIKPDEIIPPEVVKDLDDYEFCLATIKTSKGSGIQVLCMFLGMDPNGPDVKKLIELGLPAKVAIKENAKELATEMRKLVKGNLQMVYGALVIDSLVTAFAMLALAKLAAADRRAKKAAEPPKPKPKPKDPPPPAPLRAIPRV